MKTDTETQPTETEAKGGDVSNSKDGVVRLCDYYPEVGDRFFKGACEIEDYHGGVRKLPDRTIVIRRIEDGNVYYQQNSEPEICDTIEDFTRMAKVSLAYGCNFFPA